MSLLREFRRRGRTIAAPTLGALLIGYFMLHAFQGERGVLPWIQLRQQVAQAEATLARSTALRERMETRISLMRSDHLDPDLLDERVRMTVGLVGPDDYVIYYRAPLKPREISPETR